MSKIKVQKWEVYFLFFVIDIYYFNEEISKYIDRSRLLEYNLKYQLSSIKFYKIIYEVCMDKYDSIKLKNQLCFPLYALSREIIKLYKPILDKYNLTYTQYIAMLVMWEKEKITFKDLGKKLHLDSGTLTPVLKKLEAMELIIKYRTKEDDRVVMVEITEKGKALKDDILEVPKEMLCKSVIDMDEVSELKAMLDKLLKRFE